MVELFNFEGWSLSVLPWPTYTETSRQRWWTVRLDNQRGKGHYGLAWNGERLANNNDLARAKKNHPDITQMAAWLLMLKLPK
jgi:hypothetical protein